MLQENTLNPLTKKCLLFVESPGKCQTIRKYLNEDKTNNYDVVATIGHIKQLPSKSGSIIVEKGEIKFLWEDKENSVKKLKDAIQQTNYDTYYIATDQDREGEGIAYHLYNLLKEMNVKGEIHRITFNEITKKALQESIKNPRDLNYDLVDAFLSRLAMDYLIGYTLSPTTWKFGSNYSVGRVQSAGVRLIIEQEQVIFDFIPITYYTLEGVFQNLDLTPKIVEFLESGYKYIDHEDNIKLLMENNGDVRKIPTESLADNIISSLLLPDNSIFTVKEIIEKDIYKSPPPPFITVSLQQEANTKLGFTAQITMRNAQKLYEDGLITYMRTDSVTISDEATDAIRLYIQSNYGEDYLSTERISYKSKIKNAQEAHEAIRPTDINNRGENIEDPRTKSLYQLIWKRSVACQMSKSLYKKKDIIIKNSISSFSLSGSQLIFLGYLKVYDREEDEDNILPPLHLEDKLILEHINKNTHVTKPPARCSEGSFIGQLKNKGIGRPSTYAGIIEILKNREYVRMDGKVMVGLMKAKILVAFLNAYFPRYIDYNFTAQMEEVLDKIANGELNWKKVIVEFYENLRQDYLKVVEVNLFEILSHMNANLQNWLRNKKCEKCDSNFNLHIKSNLFFSCSKCGHNIPLKDEFKFVVKDKEEDGTPKPFVKYKKFSKSKKKTPQKKKST